MLVLAERHTSTMVMYAFQRTLYDAMTPNKPMGLSATAVLDIKELHAVERTPGFAKYHPGSLRAAKEP